MIFQVIGKMVVVIVMSAFMRLKYWINPSAGKTDVEKTIKDGQNIARNNKYAPDPEDVAKDYLWSWKLIKKHSLHPFLSSVGIEPRLQAKHFALPAAA